LVIHPFVEMTSGLMLRRLTFPMCFASQDSCGL
jgi:hypothetical protein